MLRTGWVWGFGFRVQGLGFGVWGLRLVAGTSERPRSKRGLRLVDYRA